MLSPRKVIVTLGCFVCGFSTMGLDLTSTINGKPLPADVFEDRTNIATDTFVARHQREPRSESDRQEIDATNHDFMCQRLQGVITLAARDLVRKELGVVVTTQDLESAKRSYPIFNPEGLQKRAAAILSALSAVYDQKKDPSQVYEEQLKKFIPKEGWTVYLHDTNTPASRAVFEKKLSSQLKVTPEVMNKVSGSLESWRKIAETTKLNEAVDQEISLTDPQFRLLLAESKPTIGSESQQDRTIEMINMDHFQYLARKRADFWKNRVSKLSVSLADTSLEKSCHLSQIGVQTVGR